MVSAQLLIVEDEQISALSIKLDLERLGYDVLAVATTAEEAIQKAAETRPDLVLMDIRLRGEEDGIEAAGAIRSQFDIPVVYLTAYADQGTLERAKATEPYGYIVKPYGEIGLHSAIEMALHKHRVERRLKDSRQQLATTLRSIHDAVITTDREGRITFLNPAAEALTGLKSNDALGQHLADRLTIVTGGSEPAPGNLVRECLDTDSPIELTHDLFIAQNGKRIPIDGSAAPIQDERGSSTGIVIILRDVTERNEADAALQQRTRALALLNQASLAFTTTLDLDRVLAAVLEETRRLLDLAACSIWLVDPQTGELVCRQATGFRPDIVRGWRLAPGEGLVGWVVRAGKSLILSDAQLDERHFVGVDQETGLAPHSTITVPLQAGQDVIGALQALDAEVGRFQPDDLMVLESLAASAAIAIKHARLYETVVQDTREWEATFNAITDGIALLDRGGTIVRANRPLASMLGVSVEELLGHVYDQIPCCQNKLLSWFLHRQVLEDGAPRTTEVGAPELGGSFLISGYPLQSDQGETTGTVCVIKDVTQQRQAQEQLLMSEKLAALGRLAASLAHEINNPLQALSSGLRLLNRRDLDEDKRAQYLGIASKEVERLIGIVGRMVGYYRPSSDTVALTDIHALMEEILALSEKELEHSDVVIQRNWCGELPLIQAVPDQLKQVFLNLILNAVDAMPDGGTLQISTGCAPAKSAIYVRFADTGHGIAQEHLDHIFEPFYTTRAQGTGLGLSISYNLVRQHGGNIEAENQPGQGAAFTVVLPTGGEERE